MRHTMPVTRRPAMADDISQTPWRMEASEKASFIADLVPRIEPLICYKVGGDPDVCRNL